ncbi:50S ribosomal protein L21e [archaeon]|jgi:large subunit ribosomal protein L21e|nr:50S ribosomal protein L21e [archaeon]
MVTRIGGFRRKTRAKLRKTVRTKGKISVSKFAHKFEDGEKVYLVLEPAVQKGSFHPRFYGKAGVINGKQGSNYYVDIKDGNKKKKLLSHPIHLRKA